MGPKLGYLLPTRERIMQGEPQTGPLLALAARAEALGFNWVLRFGIRCWPGRGTSR